MVKLEEKVMLLEDGQKILFAGDSVTDDGRARPVGEGNWAALGNGFVRLIDSCLAAEYPERKIHTVNMGISGNTSRDLLARWETDVNALKPDWVVLCIGFNDVWRQFDSPAISEWAVSPQESQTHGGKYQGKNDLDDALLSRIKYGRRHEKAHGRIRRNYEENRRGKRDSVHRFTEKIRKAFEISVSRIYYLGQNTSRRGRKRRHRPCFFGNGGILLE